MLFNGRALIFTFSGTQVRIAEIERLQSLFKMSESARLRKSSFSKAQGLRETGSRPVTLGLGLTTTIKPNVTDRKLGGPASPALRFPNSRMKRNIIQLALHRPVAIYIRCDTRVTVPQRISASLCGCGRGLAAACGVSTGA